MRKISMYDSYLDAFSWSETSDMRGMCLHGRKHWKVKERSDELEISIITLNIPYF